MWEVSVAVRDHGLDAIRKSAEGLDSPTDTDEFVIRTRLNNTAASPANVLITPSNTGTTTVKTDLSTSEFEIIAVTGQTSISVMSLSNGRVHYSLNTGVDTTYGFLNRNEELELINYSGSIFVVRASDTGTIQIDQRSKV